MAWVLLGDGFDGSRIVPWGTWRHYALVAALPAATALVLTVFFIPESPRFLAKAGTSICEVYSVWGVTMTALFEIICHNTTQRTMHELHVHREVRVDFAEGRKLSPTVAEYNRTTWKRATR